MPKPSQRIHISPRNPAPKRHRFIVEAYYRDRDKWLSLATADTEKVAVESAVRFGQALADVRVRDGKTGEVMWP
jgi:hypothetical protein